MFIVQNCTVNDVINLTINKLPHPVSENVRIGKRAILALEKDKNGYNSSLPKICSALVHSRCWTGDWKGIRVIKLSAPIITKGSLLWEPD